MTKIFLTGATGYIGGDALYALATAHPEYEITALVRSSDKGAPIAAQHPSVRLVYGDLDSEDLLRTEAGKADVVCHFAHADHAVSARALLSGLASTHSAAKPGFYIHTSGTGILLYTDIRSGTYGEASEDVYDDLAGVSRVTSLPDDAPHREVDKIVLAAATGVSSFENDVEGPKGEPGVVKTAIVCPPTIYGAGRGAVKKVSHQVPALVRATLKRGYGVQVGAGKTLWGNVHVADLSDLYLKLVEEAAAGGSTKEWDGKPAVWGAEGYYFCENGEHVWGDVSHSIAKLAKKQGLIEGDEVRSLGKEDADLCTPWGSALWGANSRAQALRAREVLGWVPKGHSLEEEIPKTFEVEAKAVGAIKGHAEVAAGNA